MTDTDLKPNAELAYRVLDHIDAHPDSWHQADWWCGTRGCFAGWAVTLSGCKIDPASGKVEHGPPDLLGRSVSGAALKLLRTSFCTDIFDEEYEDLFDGGNDREDLGRIVAELFGPRPQPTRFWQCPVEGHRYRHDRDGKPLPTVEWDGDVAGCLAYACGRTSTDPVPRGECLCEGDTADGEECVGECCGPGQCSCTPDEPTRGDL